MSDERANQIKLLSRKNTFQRNEHKLRIQLSEIMTSNEFETIELEKLDQVIESHPFRYPDWDDNLIRSFNEIDKNIITNSLTLILSNLDRVYLYFMSYGIAVIIKSKKIITDWSNIIIIDEGLIVYDPNSQNALKIEKCNDQIEFNVTENGWKLYN